MLLRLSLDSFPILSFLEEKQVHHPYLDQVALVAPLSTYAQKIKLGFYGRIEESVQMVVDPWWTKSGGEWGMQDLERACIHTAPGKEEAVLDMLQTIKNQLHTGQLTWNPYYFLFHRPIQTYICFPKWRGVREFSCHFEYWKGWNIVRNASYFRIICDAEFFREWNTVSGKGNKIIP